MRLVIVGIVICAMLIGSVLPAFSLDGLGILSVKSAYAATPTPIYRVASGLIYSDSLTTGTTSYWGFNGSAAVLNAPHAYSENSTGLNFSLLAPGANQWAGYFGITPVTPARLFHARITLGAARPTTGLLDTAVYVQQQMQSDPRIDAMGCGADIYPTVTHWTISLQAGDRDHEIVPQTVYSDNNPSQPTSRECTLVTDGNQSLIAYIDGQKVFSSNQMNLNMPEPFQYYVELQTNSISPSNGTNFTGSFSDYYATSSNAIRVLNAAPGSIAELVNATSGTVLTTAVVSASHQASMDVGMYHMPINASVQVFDNTGSNLIASSSAYGMYGGDVYNVGSASVHQPNITIISRNQTSNSNFPGIFTNVTLSTGIVSNVTAMTFTAPAFQPFMASVTDDGTHTFAHWQDSISTPLREVRPNATDQQLIAYFANSNLPEEPSSLTSLTQYTTNINNPTITGVGTPGLSVQLYDKGLPISSPVVVPSNGTWFITTPSLSDGSHVFTATETNNTSSLTSTSSGHITMTIDTAPPSVTVSGTYTAFDNASITGTATDSIVGIKAVDVELDNNAVFTPASQKKIGDWSNWSYQSAQLLPGTHLITARATNLAGGQAFASMNLTIPQPNPSILVNSTDTSGVKVTGMWTVLSQNGAVVRTGFTPVNFRTTAGQNYSILVADYGTNYFDHWYSPATGQIFYTRSVTIMSIENPIQFTAVYRHTQQPPGSSFVVNGADLNGVGVNGMYTTLTDTTSNGIVQTGFTNVTYATVNGDPYVLSVSDYGTNYFDHWHNGATGQDSSTRNLAITATNSSIQLTAVFRHTAAGSGSSIVISGADLNGVAINGMYTTLTNTNDNTVQHGFTTVNYPTTAGYTYVASASDYGTNYFDHWHNGATGQDSYARSLALSATSNPIQLTVVFRHTIAPQGSNIVVSGAELNGTAVNGMYVTITNTTDSSVRSGFTTTVFTTDIGQTYILTASDFGSNYFDHWHNGATGQDLTTRALAINATSGTINLTIVYRNTP